MRRVVGVAIAAVMVVAMVPASPVAADVPFVPAVRVWQPGGLTPDAQQRIVDVATDRGWRWSVRHAGTLQLTSVTRGEEIIQAAPNGFVYPMSSVAVDPAAAREPLGSVIADALALGEVVMGETSARLRGAQPGDQVTFFGWDGTLRTFRLAAIAPDQLVGYAELVFDTEVAAGFGFDRPSSVDVWGDAEVGEIADALERTLLDVLVGVVRPDDPVDVDGTLPTAVVKQRFGEFAYRPTGSGDAIQIEPSWVEANIVTIDWPLFGLFRCHRAVLPYLEAALEDVVEQGFAGQIDRQDFQVAGGCYNPRLIRGGDKGGAISRHSWGIAIDINPSANPYGGVVTFDPRFAAILQEWGFAWGGGWLFTDGGHFEWNHLPSHLSDV